MKKIFVMILIGALSVGLLGCQKQPENPASHLEETEPEEAAQVGDADNTVETVLAESDEVKSDSIDFISGEENKESNEVEKGTEKTSPESGAVAEDSIGAEEKRVLDGYYVSCMTGTEKGIISMEVVDDALHIKGKVVYDEMDADNASDKYYNEYDFADKADVGEYIFLLSEDTQFIASGGKSDSTYDRQKFEELYCTRPDLGLGLYITVENGVVTKIETAS